MRRRDRDITDPAACRALLARGRVLHLSLCDGDRPYGLALNYGWSWPLDRGLSLFFHCAPEGRKLEIIARNPQAAFFLYEDRGLVSGPRPCDWGQTYLSLAGEGALLRLETDEERRLALDRLMDQYDPDGPRDYDPGVFRRTAALELRVTAFSLKESPGL